MKKLLLLALLIAGCSTDPDEKYECTDPTACMSGNVCWYPNDGCSCDEGQGADLDDCFKCGGTMVKQGEFYCDISEDNCLGIYPYCDCGKGIDDCLGVCGGDAVYDYCGLDCTEDPEADCSEHCDADPFNDCIQDCAGKWGGDAVELWDVCYSIEATTEISYFCYGCNSDEKLTGIIPSEIGNLINLISLDLSYNSLTGSIPPEIGNLPNLEVLKLYDNQLTGEIPSEIGNLITLTSLMLELNEFTGKIPSTIGQMTNLTKLHLCDNQLSGLIPPEIGNLTNLTKLHLCINQLTGEIPSEIENLTNLTELWLFNNQLTGEIPVEICNQEGLYLLIGNTLLYCQ